MGELKTLFGTDLGLDDKSLDMLMSALERSNLPGFDYIEFKQSLDKLAKMGIDESTAFKSAFATASTMGLTKDKLIQTTNHYREVIAKEKEQFNQALQKQQDQRIAAKLKEIADLKANVEKWQGEIKKLEAEIGTAQSVIRDNDYMIEKEIHKLDGTKQSFEFAHQSILNQIDKDIENINKHL